MYSLRPRPEHLFLRFIEDEAKVGTSFRHPMQPNHRITYGRIPQFDYILRICSLINAKHLNVYIYIYTNTIEETQFGAMSSQVAICSRRIPLDGCTLLRCSFRNFEYTIHSDSSSLLCSTSQLVSLSFDFSSPFTSLRIFTRRIVKFESSPFPSFLYSFRRLTKD